VKRPQRRTVRNIACYFDSFSRSEKDEALPFIYDMPSPHALIMLSRSNLIRSRFVVASHRWLQSQRPYNMTKNTNTNVQQRLLSCATQFITIANEDEIDDSFEIWVYHANAPSPRTI
jgi:hypothetical protein